LANRTLALDDTLYDYLCSVSLRENDVQRRLREETAKMPNANMQIAPEQGQFMGLLVELLGVSRALEVGTFTGYSALSVALALPAKGKLVACDVSEEWTGVAKRYWEEAGVADKIELRLGPGSETLQSLINEGHRESFDFAFIDADKTGYDNYYEACLELIRTGGLISIDNAFLEGKVVDPSVDEPDTNAIRAMNDKLKKDERVSCSLVPIGDGLLLARKR